VPYFYTNLWIGSNYASKSYAGKAIIDSMNHYSMVGRNALDKNSDTLVYEQKYLEATNTTEQIIV
jgi:hypothetical protein